MTMDLYYCEETNSYYWTGNDTCSKCNNIIIHLGYLLWDYWSSEFRQELFCYGCRKDLVKVNGKYVEYKKVFIVDNSRLPLTAIGIFPERPELSPSKDLTVWDVAVKNISGEKVVDNAVACRDRDFMIDTKVKKELDKLDSELNDDDVKALLDFHKKN